MLRALRTHFTIHSLRGRRRFLPALIVGMGLVVPSLPRVHAIVTESKVTRLTREPETDAQATWAPDGKRIAFVSSRGGSRSLWLSHLGESSAPELLIPGLGENEFIDGPDWSRDGKRIVYSSNRGNSPVPKLWVFELATKAHTRLTTNGSIDWMPTWSPDGRHLAFVSDRSGLDCLWTIRSDGKELRRVIDQAWNPTWSPEGDWIAFQSLQPGREGLMVARPDGTQQALILPGGTEATWSPDGRRLIVVVRKGNERQLWIVNRDGSNARHLSMPGTGIANPAWSPEGAQVVYDQTVANNRDLYVLELKRTLPSVQLELPELSSVRTRLPTALRIVGTAGAGARRLALEFGGGVDPRLWTPIRAFQETLAGGGLQIVADWELKGLGGHHVVRCTATDEEGDTATAIVKVVLPSDFGVKFLKTDTPAVIVADQFYEVPLSLENTGAMTWLESGRYAVTACYRWIGTNGDVVVKQGLRTRIPQSLVQGEKADLLARLQAPKTPGFYLLEWDLLQGETLWFSEQHTLTERVAVEVVVPLSADFLGSTTPARMTPGQQYSVELMIRNNGASAWSSAGAARIAVAYRWFSDAAAALDDRPIVTSLPASIAAGQTATLTARVQAPTVPGHYELRWDLLTGPTWFAELGSRTLNLPVRVEPLFGFQFVEHNTPTSMVPGDTYVVALRLRNLGSVRWAPGTENAVRVGYRWREDGGQVHPQQPLFAELANDVASGQVVGVSARVQAPARAGSYTLEWDVQQGEGWLSEQGSKPLASSIVVARQQYSPRYGADRHPSTMNVGTAYTIRLQLRNDGLLTWSPLGRHPVKLGYHWLDSAGRSLKLETVAAVLPDPVPLGGSTAVNARVLAPTRPGSYTLQWDLLHEGQAWFSERGATTLNVPIVVEPIYQARFLTHDTPLAMVKGQTYTVQLRLRNEGTLPWTAKSGVRVQLSYRWFNEKGAAVILKGLVTDLPHDVEKGDTVDVIAQIQGPEVPGHFTLRWDLTHGGLIWFADKASAALEIKVQVR